MRGGGEHALHGEVRVGRHQGQQRFRGLVQGFCMNASHPINYAWSSLQSNTQRIRRNAMLHVDVGILHAFIHLSLKGAAKQIAEAKVGSALAPFVVERCFIGGNNAAAASHILFQLLTLRIGQRGDVR